MLVQLPARQGLCGVRCLDVAVDAMTLLLPRKLCNLLRGDDSARRYATSALTPWHRLARPIPPTNARALHSCATHFREVVVLSHRSFLARCVAYATSVLTPSSCSSIATASSALQELQACWRMLVELEYRFDGPVPLQQLLHEV